MGPYGQAQDKKKEGRSLLRRAVVVTSYGTSSRTILFCSKRVSFEKNTHLLHGQRLLIVLILNLRYFFEFDARISRLTLFLIQKGRT